MDNYKETVEQVHHQTSTQLRTLLELRNESLHMQHYSELSLLINAVIETNSKSGQIIQRIKMGELREV